ncbi:endoglucanase-like protein II [Phaeosphaeria sp. MPI-PUGE-AT-0046c]|nr:endoglucanase-like protein II [Phaeosphaeria sp. MPI-PUGE-AT-0046c]
MKTSVIALALAGGVQLATAHTTLWNVLVNGKDQGVGNKQGGYIDSPPNNNPVTNVADKSMQCNVAGVKASKSISVAGGDELTFQWYHDTNSASDDIIATSHKGPIMVYASKAGNTLSWTKLWEDKSSGTWAVDKLLAGSYTGKKGQHKMKMPALAPGEYILRPEILALHEGNREGGAQFYMECVHVTVGGSGTKTLPAGVSFPGAYKANDPGVLFNIYGGSSSYPGVGPAVWNGASSASSGSSPATTPKPAASPAAPATTLATVVKPAETPAAGSGSATAQKYAQCGGQGYSGATSCASGSTCTKMNDYYSQCQ